MASADTNSKSNHFHRTLQLHINCGADILRAFVDKKISGTGRSLKEHLNDNHAQFLDLRSKKLIKKPQWALLYPEPLPNQMDVTLLSCMILNGHFGLSSSEENLIQELRTERNNLSHVPKAELPDDTMFIRGKKIILGIGNIVGKDQKERTNKMIDEVQTKELIKCHSNIEIVMLRGEAYMVKLVKASTDEKVEKGDTTFYRFALTKWAKRFTLAIDIDCLLEALKTDSVVTATEIEQIQHNYSKAEQCHALILKMVDKPNHHLHKFLRCLRSLNADLADLIENKADDGESTGKIIHDMEKKLKKDAVRKVLRKEENKEVSFADTHEVVGEVFDHGVLFSDLEKLIVKEFDIDPPKVNEYSFFGICLTEEGENILKSCSLLGNSSASTRTTEDHECVLTNDNFIDYVHSAIDGVKPGYGQMVREALEKECVSLTCFSMLSRDEIDDMMSGYLKGNKMIMGVRKKIQEVQSNIQRMLTKARNGVENSENNLRPFDKPSHETRYGNGKVKVTTGNLLEPVHEFKLLPSSDGSNTAFVIRESIKFISACMNSRRNGTIHFGIDTNCRIHGLELYHTFSMKKLQVCLARAMKGCFSSGMESAVRRCVRPFQLVEIIEHDHVLELDVVPSSWNTGNMFFETKFPPLGRQEERFFVYNEGSPCDIVSVPMNKVEETKPLYMRNIKEREKLENVSVSALRKSEATHQKLRSRLTDGREYCTDRFIPILCCGNISGVENEHEIREHLSNHISDAFLSSIAILDFDASTFQRKAIEKDLPAYFMVKTTETELDSDYEDMKTPWIYCNGNEELSKPILAVNEWYRDRFSYLKNILTYIKKFMPQHRTIIICLVFDELKKSNPMLEFLYYCMSLEFRNECAVITDDEKNTTELKRKVKKRSTPDEDVDKHFYSGLSWKDIAQLLRSVFKSQKRNDVSLPCSDGREVFLSKQQITEMNLHDIEILSGRMCQEEDEMDDETRRDKEVGEKEKFYRGEEASWWNYHYESHVGPRNMYRTHLIDIQKTLQEEGQRLIETKLILHQPGAGGTTAGKYLLWHLSQFQFLDIAKSHRCCIVKEITDDTPRQIYDFLSYDDPNPKPVVALIDNASEESVDMLKVELNGKAYKKHHSGSNLFCLLIIIKRIPASHYKASEQILGHQLTRNERTWFENKYKELEKDEHLNVDTLISFNVMRKDFDKRFVDDLAKKFLHDINGNELDILKCLSLINRFDRDNAIPLNIFDSLRQNNQCRTHKLNLQDCIGRGPWGLVVQLAKKIEKKTDNVWDVDISSSLSLLIKRTYGSTSKGLVRSHFLHNGVMILSQALAKAVLDNIMEQQKIRLPNVVEFVLEMEQGHVREENPMSKEFVRIVNSLFKTRQLLSERGDTKAKFSDLVIELRGGTTQDGDENDDNTAIKLMKQCFDITEDAMVGQQLSRLFIFLKKFDKATEAIEKSVSLQPKNSYLLDTHGQVFYSKMIHLFSQFQPMSISDQTTAELINTAFQAIAKFRLGQEVTFEEEAGYNNSCFIMLVKTSLDLLENFHKFSCHKSEEELIEVLNNPDIPLERTNYRTLAKTCQLEDLRYGMKTQADIENSLRMLEERQYQLKQTLYTIHTPKGELLLIDLRERFERFYGNKTSRDDFKFKYGVGLKSIMTVYDTDLTTLAKKVEDASEALRRCEIGSTKKTDRRDLLVVLGYEVVKMSLIGADEKISNPLRMDDYCRFLRFAEKLLAIEKKSHRPHLEAFLYFTILNWPSDSRNYVTNLCRPEALKNAIQEWDAAFRQNFRQDSEKKRHAFPKTYFAFGNRTLGCDIVDFSKVEELWRNKKNIKRYYVKDDQVLKEQFVIDVLKRFEGILNQNGTAVAYESKWGEYWEYHLDITAYQPKRELSNRKVTFILLFTWAGPRAHDIQEYATDVVAGHKKEKNEEIQMTAAENTKKPGSPHSRGEKEVSRPKVEHKDSMVGNEKEKDKERQMTASDNNKKTGSPHSRSEKDLPRAKVEHKVTAPETRNEQENNNVKPETSHSESEKESPRATGEHKVKARRNEGVGKKKR